MSVAIKSIQIRPAKNPAKARRLRARVVVSPYGVRSLSITPLGLGRLLFPIIAREGLSIRLRGRVTVDSLPKGVKYVGRSKEAREARAAKKKTQAPAASETQFSPPDEITSAVFAAEAVTTKRRRTSKRKSTAAT